MRNVKCIIGTYINLGIYYLVYMTEKTNAYIVSSQNDHNIMFHYKGYNIVRLYLMYYIFYVIYTICYLTT